MGNFFDQFDGGQSSNFFDQFDAPPAPKATLGDRVKDLGVTALKGAVSVPEAAIGLADIPTFGVAGKAAEAIGIRPKDAQKELDQWYSPAQQAANAAVHNAKGFGGTVSAALDNPSTIAHSIGESLPLMLAGGVVSRGLMAAGKIASPLLAGAAGEGIVGAGSAAEQLRQGSDDGYLGPKQIAASIASGLGTAAFGAAGGKVANKLGLDDLETAMARGGLNPANAAKRGLPARLAGGALSEGVLEELPQSMWEQAMQNAGSGRPLMEGVPEAGAMGMVTGGVMGGGFNLLGFGHNRQPQPTNDAPNAPRDLLAGYQPVMGGGVNADFIDQQIGIGERAGVSQNEVRSAYNAKLPEPVWVADPQGNPYLITTQGDWYDYAHGQLFDEDTRAGQNFGYGSASSAGKAGKATGLDISTSAFSIPEGTELQGLGSASMDIDPMTMMPRVKPTAQGQTNATQPTQVATEAGQAPSQEAPKQATPRGKAAKDFESRLTQAVADGKIAQDDKLVSDWHSTKKLAADAKSFTQALDDRLAGETVLPASPEQRLQQQVKTNAVAKLQKASPRDRQIINAVLGWDAEGNQVEQPKSYDEVGTQFGFKPSAARAGVNAVLKKYGIDKKVIDSLVSEGDVAERGKEKEEEIDAPVTVLKPDAQGNLIPTEVIPAKQKRKVIKTAKGETTGGNSTVAELLQSQGEDGAVGDLDAAGFSVLDRAGDTKAVEDSQTAKQTAEANKVLKGSEKLVAERPTEDHELVKANREAAAAIEKAKAESELEASKAPEVWRDHKGLPIQQVDIDDAAADYDEDLRPADGTYHADKAFAELPKADQMRYVKGYIAYMDGAINAQGLARILGDIADENRQRKDATSKRAVEEKATVEEVQAAFQGRSEAPEESGAEPRTENTQAEAQSAEEVSLTPQTIAAAWNEGIAGSPLPTFMNLTDEEQQWLLGAHDEASLNQRAQEVLDGRLGEDAQFSKKENDQGTTRDAIASKLKPLFFSGTRFQNKVVVVQSRAELENIPEARSVAVDDQTQAFVQGGKVFMIADNIAPGQELAVFLHEVGVHLGMKKLIGETNFNRLAAQLDNWAKSTSNSQEAQLARKALERMQSAEGQYDAEEHVAYFVEEAVNAGINPTALSKIEGPLQQWFRTLWNAIKSALQQLGVNRLDRLSAQDLVDLAYGAANIELDGPYQATEATEPKFSKKPVTEQVIESLPEKTQEQVRYAADSLSTAAKKAAYFTMFTDDLVDRAAKVLKSAKKWYDLVNAKAVEMTKREALIDEIAADFDKLSRGEFSRTWDSILKMTSEQKWGYQPSWRGTVTVDPPMAKLYNELSDTEKQLLDRVFKHGDENLKEMQKTLDQIVDQEFADKLARAKTPDSRTKVEAEKGKFTRLFGRKLSEMQGPYAPMRRVGSHVTVAMSQRYVDAPDAEKANLKSDPQHYQVVFTDSQAQANKAKRDFEKQGYKSYAREKETFLNEVHGLPFEAFDQIRRMLQTEDSAVATKMNNLLNELYLTSLAETSSRKSEIKRQVVAGLDADGMYRAFISKGKADAHYLSVLKKGKEVADAFAEMRNEAHQSEDPDSMRVLNELSARYANSFKYDQSPVIGKLMSFNTMWMLLTKPAYFLYNATQPALMTQPYLSQKFGYKNSGAALIQAYKDVMGLPSFLKGKHLDLQGLPSDVEAAIHELRDMGKIDITIVQDLGSRLRAGTSQVSRGVAMIDRTLKGMAQKVEMTNRLVTGIAAFRLGMEKGMSRSDAIEYAAKAIDKTQGDYSNFNAPRLMNQNSTAKLLTQFRKFQLIQVSYLVRMFKDAVANANPEERSAARAALIYVMGHHAILAGAMGLPAAGIMALAFAAMGGGDEPKDAELEMRKALGNGFVADLITRGVPAAVFNTNISGNVGMGQTFSLLPFTDIELGKKEGYGQLVTGAMGPLIGGLGQQAWDALGAMHRGDYYKGLEGLMPSGIRYASKALREANRGATNNRGDVLVTPEEISLFDTMLKLGGVRTMNDSRRQLVRNAKYDFEKFYEDKTTQMKKGYAEAYRSGDGATMGELRDEWRDMQNSKRDYGFSTQPLSHLLKAPMEQAKRERNTRDGVQFNKSSKRFMDRLETE